MDGERELAIREILSDLGWIPSDLKCEEKRHLAEEYLNATATWFEVGRGLRLTIWSSCVKLTKSRGQENATQWVRQSTKLA